MTRIIDEGTYRLHLQQIFGAGADEGEQGWGRAAGVEPERVVGGGQNDRHPVMYGAREGVGFGRDERAGFDLCTIGC